MTDEGTTDSPLQWSRATIRWTRDGHELVVPSRLNPRASLRFEEFLGNLGLLDIRHGRVQVRPGKPVEEDRVFEEGELLLRSRRLFEDYDAADLRAELDTAAWDARAQAAAEAEADEPRTASFLAVLRAEAGSDDVSAKETPG